MSVDLLVTRDCRHSDAAEALLRSALDDLGCLSQVPIGVTVVHTQQDADRRNFPG